MAEPQTWEHGNVLQEKELELLGESIADHLRRELVLLDKVIGCSQRMQDILQRSAIPIQVSSQSEHLQNTDDENRLHGIHQIRDELSDQFDSISGQRNKFFQIIKNLTRESEPTPTLNQLATRLPQALRNQLTDLRTEIKLKLQEIQAMTMGNQTVLMYTIDFYHRLVSGISGGENQQQAYDAHGKMATKTDFHTLQTRC